ACTQGTTRLRAAAEQCATTVLDHAGRALGASPLCREPAFARLFADLPVFIRQSHAERDLAALGEITAGSERSFGEGGAWVL
ncbi:MAG: acyl-CoA dehydrogenase, partial [Comamonadaceae bacterium]